MPDNELLRRTWPQRLVLLSSMAVIVAALVAAWGVRTVFQGVAQIGRVEISGEVLINPTSAVQPVNFLLVGTDSTDGLDPNDPINIGRIEDPRGRGLADTIAILRLDPVSQQAWVLPIPRDLYVPIPGSTNYRINAALLIGGPEKLIETIKSVFDIEINHYVQVDFKGFQEVVDQIGGVPVWFPNPTKSVATGLNIQSAGCWVLDGVDALRYVRPRKDYQEFIDGKWVTTGSRDFERIQRQQDFLVLALDRAIQRGARNPQTMLKLINAGAKSVVLDERLTPNELLKFADSFSSFNPDNITRYALTVTTRFSDDGSTYIGEILVDGADSDALEVFRGASDAEKPSDITFDLYSADTSVLTGDSAALTGVGFDVASEQQIDSPVPHSVVVYPPGQVAAAQTIARYLLPVPALVEDPTATRTAVILGADHEQVLFLFPRDTAETLAEIARLGVVDIPDLGGSPTFVTTTVSGAGPTTRGIDSASVSTTLAPTTTLVPTTTTISIMGRPPEGQSCG